MNAKGFGGGSKKSVQQGHSQFQARSAHFVREHRKLARTLLAVFSTDPTTIDQKKVHFKEKGGIPWEIKAGKRIKTKPKNRKPNN